MSALNEVIDLAKIDEAQSIKIGGTMSKTARGKLIELLNILDCEDLIVSLNVRRIDEQNYRLTGDIALTITQACVLTDSPLTSRIESQVALDLIASEDPHSADPLEMLELSGGADPEYLPDGRLVLIDLISDCLLLDIDPFPKAEGAETEFNLPPGVELNAPPQKPASPFAALAELKK